ncbi:MAG: DUF4145 domain-containing protein [Burkholderiales bacterium]|nr:DUF4145 domain-containing protein [Burkholderiales bacterium]
MTAKVTTLHVLDQIDADLLRNMLDACEVQGDFVDAKRYRNEHIENRLAFERLAREGYILLERAGEQERYRVSLTAIVQLEQNDAARRILNVAERLWSAFQEHYRVALEGPITLKHLSDVLNVELPFLSRVHTYMRECSHTPYCFTTADTMYQSVTVCEEVRHFESFADCVHEMRVWQADRINSPGNGLFGLSQVDLLTECQSVVSARPPVSIPGWVSKLPPHAQKLMGEVYIALDAQLLSLPAMGIRAVIDVVSANLLGTDLNSFDEKLEALRSRGSITTQQFISLTAVVDAGNAASHREFIPDRDDIQIMLDSLSHMLQSVYVMDEAANALSSKTPKRPKRSKPAKIT